MNGSIKSGFFYFSGTTSFYKNNGVTYAPLANNSVFVSRFSTTDMSGSFDAWLSCIEPTDLVERNSGLSFSVADSAGD